MAELKHVSVLLDEAINGLKIKHDGIYVDATLGGGGHAKAVLKKLDQGFLYAFDQDPLAIKIADENLKEVSDHFKIIQANFVNLASLIRNEGVSGVDGILYDIGVSSFQFDLPERGFSYRFDGPLDMRMNTEQTLDAQTVINSYSESELKRIIYEYGEEKYAPLIAKKIVKSRSVKPIKTTLELVEVIKSALPAVALRGSTHPAKQTFQAIRIEVNKELEVLAESLKASLGLLNKGGRLVIITFHSLEDKVVKKLFKEATTLDLPKGLPFIPEGYEVKYQLINHKVIIPSEEEIKNNPRSHSAKMRIIEKL